MEKKRWVLAGGLCVFLLLGLVTQGETLFIDDKKSLEISAKVQTRATVRLQESDTEENLKGYSWPEVDSWDLVQHRNLALVEIN
ncbi:MAG: hypothetical protein AB1640_15360, partial [bacterium]